VEDKRSRRGGEVSRAAAAAVIVVRIDEGRFVVERRGDAAPVPPSRQRAQWQYNRRIAPPLKTGDGKMEVSQHGRVCARGEFRTSSLPLRQSDQLEHGSGVPPDPIRGGGDAANPAPSTPLLHPKSNGWSRSSSVRRPRGRSAARPRPPSSPPWWRRRGTIAPPGGPVPVGGGPPACRSRRSTQRRRPSAPPSTTTTTTTTAADRRRRRAGGAGAGRARPTQS
jgi:hypothetical protein